MKLIVLASFLLLELIAEIFGLSLSIALGFSAKNAIIYLMALTLMVEFSIRQNFKLELRSVLIPYALIVGYSMISLFSTAFVLERPAYDAYAATISLKNNLVDHALVFLIFFFGIAAKEQALSFVRFFAWVAILGNLVSVVDAFNIPDLGLIHQRADGRVSGPFGESNAYGAFLATSLPAIVVLAYESRGLLRSLALFGMLISVLALFLTASRGAFVGLALGFIFSVFFLRSYLSFRRIAAGLVAAPIVLAVVLSTMYATGYLDLLQERFVSNATGTLADQSSSRTTIWTVALARMVEEPLSFVTGFGWSAYSFLDDLHFKSMHNFYLNRLFNLGGIGLALYLTLFISILAVCRRTLHYATTELRPHIVASVFGLASLGGCILFVDLHDPWIMIWAYIGIIMRLSADAQTAARPAEGPVSLEVSTRHAAQGGLGSIG